MYNKLKRVIFLPKSVEFSLLLFLAVGQRNSEIIRPIEFLVKEKGSVSR